MSTTVVINRFDGGMVNDPQDTRSNVCLRCENFDTFSVPHRLLPYRNSESGDASASDNKIANFIYLNGLLYGLGVDSGASDIADVKYMASFPSGSWSQYKPWVGNVATNARTTGDTKAFAVYHGVFYGVQGARYVWAANPSSSAVDGVSGLSGVATEADLTSYSSVSNMLVHSKDDCLYLGHDNKIARKNASTWEVAALTLPSRYTITSLCEYGNYLAIACIDNQGGDSLVYLWDRDSSLETLSEVIHWGADRLQLIGDYAGAIVGLSEEQDANTQDKMASIRYWSGGSTPTNLFSFTGSVSAIRSASQKRSGRLYFMATLPIGEDACHGIWALVRGPSGNFALTLEYALSNDTSYDEPALYSFIIAGDYFIQAFQDDTDAWKMTKTVNLSTSNAYLNPAIRETTINPNMPVLDRAAKKQLATVAVSCEPLASGQAVTVKFRVDDGSWITVFTLDEDGETTFEQVFDTNGDPFVAGRDIEFRLESTGGAEITGLTYRYNKLTTAL